MVQGEKARGVVIEAMPNATFKVEIQDRHILCYLAGRMRVNHIKTIPGDKVEVVLSPDGEKGRIIKRF